MRYITLGILFFLSLNSCAQKSTDYSKLNDYFAELEKNNRFMGNVLIMKGDKVVYENELGYRDEGAKVKHDANSIFRIGSITKTYTSLLVLKLVEEGKLSLEDKLNKFFPKIKNAEKISIKQLLNHSSGLANYTDQANFSDYLNIAQSQQQMLARFEELPSDFEPGTKHEYSNTNFILLGYIIETVSGKSYAENLEEKILKPLALKNTYYQLGNGILNNESKSYVWMGAWEKMPNWNLDVAASAGAMRATTKELALFAHHLFQGNLLTSASLKQMTSFEDGYGLGLLKAPFYAKSLLMHGGKIEGFHSLFFHDQTEDVTFIILCNASNFKQNDITLAMASAYYGKEFEVPDMAEKAALDLPVSTLTQYEGLYTSDKFPLDITVFVKENEVQAQATGQGAFPLKAIAEAEFIFEAANIKMKFIKKEGSYTQLQFQQGSLDVLFNKK